MRPVTPRGFRDVLPREAAERETIIRATADVFSAWGYDRVEPPVVEVFETLRQAAGDLEGTAFRLLDVDGKLLALRPDMTVPVARLVAARMSDAADVRRLRYVGDVFREHESLRGQMRQFTQVGVELLGAAGPAADVEVIAMLVEALSAAGLTDFTVAVGDVAVLFALVDAACDDNSWRAGVLAAAHERNVVTFDALTRDQRIAPSTGEALRELVRIRGGAEAIASCRRLVERFGCGAVLDELAVSWDLLESAGAAERVVVDFGVMRAFDYYTGIVFEAYAPGVGLPLGAGGRYDGVLGSYGAPAPAVGFAMGLERLTIALAEQGAAVPVPEAPVLVGGPASEAFAEAAKLRASGVRAALAPGLEGGELKREADRMKTRAVEAR